LQIAQTNALLNEISHGDTAWLTQEELARYQAISQVLRKKQFLAGHYLVRKIASGIFKNQFYDWTYFQDVGGLRRLKYSDNSSALYVSISHSGEWIAAAVSQTPVGIDIENFGKQRDFIAIANHVFSVTEIEHLKSCSAEELKPNFYLYWTLKECAAKQHGHGLKFETSRMNTPQLASELEQASMQSWQCPDYVVSMSNQSVDDININGLADDFQLKRWG
jgi:4'-phosphopantetheinyl transferase